MSAELMQSTYIVAGLIIFILVVIVIFGLVICHRLSSQTELVQSFAQEVLMKMNVLIDAVQDISPVSGNYLEEE